jgi:diguanylate cyclase (GGDEF)-like protein/putative nucleotidyltransferase with HDIG domain
LAAAENEGLQSSVAVPLWSKDVLHGGLVLASRAPRRFSTDDLELLQAIASEIAVGIENAKLFEEMRNAAITDGLTGLYNHRHFQERLEEEVARTLRFGGECSLMMLDLDYFKIYNDLLGHVAGDEALRRVGQVLRDSTRQVDITCRYGGEEFAVILPQTGSLYAHQAAERLRQAVEAAFALERGSSGANMTVSLGVASCPSDALSRQDLVQLADIALREAKAQGRNQTCLASDLATVALENGEAGWEVEKHLKAVGLNKIYALAAGVDARDHYTYRHSRNVSKYAVDMGKTLGLSAVEIERLRIAGLLHDIGKIGISDSTIRKPGPLDEEEWKMMRKHSELGATIVSHMPELVDCAPAIRHHHEQYDGSGYPSGLKGEGIPLEARIIAIADAYDTITTPRSYRQMVSPQEALEELRSSANTQFDPLLVETFSRMVNTGGVPS